MSNQRVRFLLVATIAAATTGCVEQFDATRLGVPATMSSPAGEPLQGDAFSLTTKSIHLLWGVVPVAKSSLQRALASQAIDTPIITGVKIRVSSRWSDLLISALTLGVVVPRTVTYEGVAVRNR
ncbi:MAG: hypothetical protein SGI84_11155 [Gemmatimonadota bacterium]|nr:hypothetical protein [Gemmatimonadota bacterium]